MPAGPHERQLSSEAAGGFRAGFAIPIPLGLTVVGIIAWFPGLDERLLGISLPPGFNLLPVSTCFLGAICLLIGSQTCDVYLTPHGLRIVRGRLQAVVPLSQIKNVSQARDSKGHRLERIRIEFRDRTPFGSSIEFLPPMRGIALGDHPLVAELRQRAGFLSSGGTSPLAHLPCAD